MEAEALWSSTLTDESLLNILKSLPNSKKNLSVFYSMFSSEKFLSLQLTSAPKSPLTSHLSKIWYQSTPNFHFHGEKKHYINYDLI